MAEQGSRSAPSSRPTSGFAGALVAARTGAGLTQEALATAAGVGLRTVQELERGAARPRRETLRRLCEALGLPLEQWLPHTARAPARPLPVWESAVPFPRTSLVDREAELREGLELLAASRLLTLTGPGGVGKTRLAVELVGRTDAERVWWVDLNGRAASPLTALALQLHVRAASEEELLAHVATALADEARPLVALDGCEHALDGSARIVAALLDRCPAVTVLCTSRSPLRLYGEAVLAVPPLPLDEGGAASRLFVERSRLVGPSLDPADAATSALVADICRRLDGLPLSIELAAAATAELSLERLGDRVRGGEALSLAGWRDSPERHRSLREVLAWSYDLLAPDEQTVFRRLAVFAGTFAPDAAEAVCGKGAQAVLPRLVEASLVAPADPGGRYRLLDTVRDYGDELLRADGETEAARLRHLAFFAGQAVRATPLLQGPEQQWWIRRLDDDLADVLAAADWAAEGGEERLVLALPMLSRPWRYWFQSGSCGEAYGRLRSLLEATGPGPWSDELRLARASGLGGACVLAMHLGDQEAALELGEESHALQGDDGHDGRADCVALALGMIRMARGEVALARPLLEEARADGDSRGDQEVRAFSRLYLGRALAVLGEHGEAERQAADALAAFEANGDAWGAASALHDLGVLARERDLGQAAGLLERSVARFAEHGDRGWHAQALADFGRVRHLQGDVDAAVALLEESERLAAEVGYGEGALERSRFLALARWDAGDRGAALAGWRQGLEAAVAAQRPLDVAAYLETGAGWLAQAAPGEAAAIREASAPLEA